MAPDKVLYKCPITGKCSPRKLHRRCNGDSCGEGNPAGHCYDCCTMCQLACKKPPAPPDYDLPEGETFEQ